MELKYNPNEIEKKWPASAKATDGQAGGYDPKIIENKWQKIWAEEKIYETGHSSSVTPKKYVLDMFPYPSGAGLHVGHMEGYVATDVLSRYFRMKGFDVLHPMGWDAFGLPAENYAIKEGVPPDKSTHENIRNFKYQLQLLGLSYDWSREIDTSSPDYYKWTQWLFIELFKKGLAYKKKAPANFCPKDETVLANEQVVDGKCERCGTEVVQKELDQWFFKITAYADKLISGLDKIDWPESTKQQQINWIGRKEGMNIKYKIDLSDAVKKVGPSQDYEIEVFTTRPDTIFGATFLVLSPDHPIAKKLNIQVKMDEKVKNGLDTGLKVVNPANGEKIPVWVSNYVLSETGTGAIMAVPFFDARDREFAEKFKLEIKKIELDERILEKLIDQGIAGKVVNYHIRDWLISRQRYWGCPIPMTYCEKDKWQPVPEADLPVLLPTDVDFLPHGESPIARSKTFQQGVKCPVCGKAARREVDTMDTYVDSSWYFYRFTDPKNEKEFASKEALNAWMPVDVYVGGGHVVQHLLFARFFHKVLVDPNGEPFMFLRAPGWILGPDNRKMSKRWGNVITPEEVVAKHGADTMRVYEMFMAPFEVDKPWNTNSVAGVNRFLTKVFNFSAKVGPFSGALERAINRLILKVSEDIENMRFNTAVSSMMEFMNVVQQEKQVGKETWEKFLLVLAPFAPHLAEELYQGLGARGQGLGKFQSVHQQSWPEIDRKYLEDRSAKVAVSINGKTRGTIEIESEKMKEEKEITEFAKNQPKIARYLEGKEIKKVVFVPGKIINFVV